MKIFGLDGKEYKTVEDCVAADKVFEEARKKAEAEEAEKKTLISKQKKEKADIIKAAEDEVALAQADYDKAREAAKEIINRAKEEARKLVTDASTKYKEATDKKYKAIADFNKEFGTYTTTYTGKEALDEYNRVMRSFNSIWDRFFDWF